MTIASARSLGFFEFFTRSAGNEAYAAAASSIRGKHAMKSASKIGFMNVTISAIALACVVSSASAQTQPSPLDLQLPQAPVRADLGGNASTPENYGDADMDDTGTSVHGAFTTGIGYSKAYGNSTVNAAELDVSKHYDNGKTLDMHIDVTRSTGIPAVSPRCYGAPYCGY